MIIIKEEILNIHMEELPAEEMIIYAGVKIEIGLVFGWTMNNNIGDMYAIL
tara:strand:+ start:73 stop:225 length:153 start_codon:yes stop_codon:yes gene_type:complete